MNTNTQAFAVNPSATIGTRVVKLDRAGFASYHYAAHPMSARLSNHLWQTMADMAVVVFESYRRRRVVGTE